MVDLEFVEMYDKGSMAITNKPTMGLNTLNELEPLDSGGEFYVVAKQGGVALTSTCPIPISVPTSNTGGTKPDMQAFEGSIDTNGNLTWESAPGLDFYYTSTPDKYNGLLSGFTWFNCDKFYNDPRPKTGLSVLIPSGYANASTVFISTNAKPNSLCGIGGHKFPVGLECNFIFVTEDNGKFRYAIKAATLINNHQETFSISETSLATAAELKAILNALP